MGSRAANAPSRAPPQGARSAIRNRPGADLPKRRQGWAGEVDRITGTAAILADESSPDHSYDGPPNSCLRQCGAPAKATAERCFDVHGRMSLSNGTPGVRIWILGKNRELGALQQDQRFDDLPRNIRTVWATGGDEWNTYLFGDFRVCPVERDRPGRMRMVHVVGGTALRVKPYSEGRQWITVGLPSTSGHSRALFRGIPLRHYM